ncbi:hypothetical protein DH2020_027788 [Rehmannia glutinosa]|uniref:E2F transcription factor CC-MB domain-containing protein n=1 Tax=Rehmannia glutinosa TaxID=99300 RepID=A0ABR0VV10_REHGL
MQKQQHSSRKQLPFTSMKPPFGGGGGGGGGGGDYHHFAAADTHRPDQEFDETIVVKRMPSLKRKTGTADSEVKSAEQNAGPGGVAVVRGPLHTPPSAKSGKAQKVLRTTKASKAGSQIPMANVGLLTKKFINLIKRAEDGILDLNNAADTLEEEVENLNLEERRLDERIRWLFVTEEDIKTLPCFQNETLIAIKAPHGTTLEVPDPDEAVDYPQRRYRIVLRAPWDPLMFTLSGMFVFLGKAKRLNLIRMEFGRLISVLNQFEENFEEINGVEAPENIPETSGANEIASAPFPTEEIRGNEIDVQRLEAQRMCSDASTSQDFVSGIMKIVPDVDSDADYWLLSDADISITDMWSIDSGIDWSNLDAIPEDYAMADITTQETQTPNTTEMPPIAPRPQTPPPSTTTMPSATDTTGS